MTGLLSTAAMLTDGPRDVGGDHGARRGGSGTLRQLALVTKQQPKQAFWWILFFGTHS